MKRFIVAVVVLLLPVPECSWASGLFSVTSSVLLLEEYAGRCSPELKQGTSIPEVAVVVDALKTAMVHNAWLLRPNVPQEQISTEVENWVAEQQKAVAEQGPTYQPCSKKLSHDDLVKVSSPSTLARIAAMGSKLEPYDVQVPVVGQSNGVMTYADPGAQESLFGAIRANKQVKCATLVVESAALASRSFPGATNLPPFVLQPILYTETWQVACDGQHLAFSVQFRQDSEGPIGMYSVEPANPAPIDR